MLGISKNEIILEALNPDKNSILIFTTFGLWSGSGGVLFT